MKEADIKTKLLLSLWMIGQPFFYFLLVAPTQKGLAAWLPGWAMKLHSIVWPWFYRPDLYNG